MKYDKQSIENMAKDVYRPEMCFEDISSLEMTEAKIEEIHASVEKEMDTFVITDEEKYDYLLRRHFENLQ